jgi:uncharacterized membrane protein HdeD (DUF308 family)
VAGGFFLQRLAGVLSIVVGLWFLRPPVDTLAALTLWVAYLLVAGGILTIVAALGYRFASWNWSPASVVIDLVLGAIIWRILDSAPAVSASPAGKPVG